MSHPYLSVVIPAYNEAQRIDATLAAAHKYLLRQRYRWELLVVLDGSTDDTLAHVRRFAAGRPGVGWIERKENRGKGYSIREGLLAAAGDVRLFMDADNSTSLDHFDRMRPLFDDGCDLVFCSRDPKDAAGARRAVPQSVLRSTAGRAGNLFIQALLLPGIWDTQCGFKAFTRRAALALCPACDMDRWSFDVEVLALAKRQNFKLGIAPADWVDDARTHVRPRHFLDMLRETAQIRGRLWRGHYDARLAAAQKLAEADGSSLLPSREKVA
ncbi:MAG: glycosyltransferase family 2 protein [Planctomycetales bacterium]|nr:glycosyltransferase family 2 protein [Planctomycetales bacterium]MBN8627281.1 glycosyltransferase family 2 protein [Planctomycetota bacterium]